MKNFFNKNRLMFILRYFLGRTPWDTNITPPEVVEFINQTPPGKALDLGCGTGTNAMALARAGWEATGVDFAPKAIRIARKKAAEAGLKIDFHVGDVADLSMLTGPFDYVLDIGCLFTLNNDDRKKYAENLAMVVNPGGVFMLYAKLPRIRKGVPWGISPEEVDSLLEGSFEKLRFVAGSENEFPSAWYWYGKK